MTPLARLTAILARAADVPDSTVLTMGGEVELELTMGDLRAVYEDALSWVTRLTSDKRLLARAEVAEANLARAREILKPFAELTVISPSWGDNSILARGDYEKLKVKHFRAASRFLTEGEGT